MLAGESYYDDEKILFTGEGLHAAYSLLYPRDKKVITKEVLDITGLMGLTALWIDCGSISPKEWERSKVALARRLIDCFTPSCMITASRHA